jgi:hypothetical protein
MKNLLFIFLLIAPMAILRGQTHPHYHRTPEDIARKQTERMLRELNIQDSVLRDTIYNLHLKFARRRAISYTRAEALQFMQEANAELQKILTPEQYQQFMNQQINHSSQRHTTPYNHIITSEDQEVQSSEHDAETNKPPTLPVSRL